MVSLWSAASVHLRLLILTSFLMSLGFYSLIPFLAVHFTADLGWSMTLAGLLLATRQFSQQGLTFLGGILSDRVGWHKTITAGVTLRALGFLGFAISVEPWSAFTAAAVSGFGGALFEPSYKAAYDSLVPAADRVRLIAFREVITNLALGASALLGTVLIGTQFSSLSVVSGLLYLSVAIIVGFGLGPCARRATLRRKPEPILRDMAHVATHRSFLVYTALLVGYYYLITQLYFSVPRAIIRATGDESWVMVFYAIISATVIVFQLRLSGWMSGYGRRFQLIGLGTLLVGMALLLISRAHQPFEILIAGGLFALGTMLASPVIVEVVPSFTKPDRVGSYYGFNGYAIAIGGAASAAVSGWLTDMGEAYQLPSLPWIVCLALAVASCLGLFLFEEVLRKRKAAPLPAAPGAVVSNN